MKPEDRTLTFNIENVKFTHLEVLMRVAELTGAELMEPFMLQLHRFDGEMWEFHAIDEPADGTATHAAFPLGISRFPDTFDKEDE